MAMLEELVRGVTVVDIRWFTADALELTCKDAAGRLGNQLLYRDDEAHLSIAMNMSEKFIQAAVEVEGGATNNLNVVGQPPKAEPDFRRGKRHLSTHLLANPARQF